MIGLRSLVALVVIGAVSARTSSAYFESDATRFAQLGTTSQANLLEQPPAPQASATTNAPGFPASTAAPAKLVSAAAYQEPVVGDPPVAAVPPAMANYDDTRRFERTWYTHIDYFFW